MQMTADSATKYQHIDITQVQTQTRGHGATMSGDASAVRTSTYGSALMLTVFKNLISNINNNNNNYTTCVWGWGL
jgi:hypothetical protein